MTGCSDVRGGGGGRWQRIEEMRDFGEEQINEPLVYDMQLARRLVERIG